MTVGLSEAPFQGWVDKTVCGRSLLEQTEAVSAWGNHGTPPVLRAMSLAALDLGRPPSTRGFALLFGCYQPFGSPYLIRDVVALCRRLGIDHTWLDEEYCCGLPLVQQAGAAQRAGILEQVAHWLTANAELAADVGAHAQAYCCAGCAHTAKAVSAAQGTAGGVYVLDVLLDALEGAALSVPPLSVAYFEGCHTSYRRHFPAVSLDWPRYRQRLEAVGGLSVRDVARKCCKTQARAIIAAAQATGAQALVCACSGCNLTLREAGRGVLPVMSYPELLLRCLDSQPVAHAG